MGAKKYLLVGIILSGCSSSGKTVQTGSQDKLEDFRCTPTKEYVTTLNFLRDTKDLKLAANDANDVAMKVAKGCRGAAGRFIKVTTMLMKARLDSRSAIEIATEIAASEEDKGQAFIDIFKYAFLRDYLDLDLSHAIELAKDLSLGFAGDAGFSRSDFEKIVTFCVSNGELNLPKAKCAETAARVTAYSARYEEKVAGAFISAVEFLRDDDDGPKLSAADALNIAEKLIAVSPHALANFEQAYRFGMAKSGLALDRVQAIAFAQKLAANTTVAIKPAAKPALKAQGSH